MISKEVKPADLTSELKRLNKILSKVYRQQSLLMSFTRGIVTGLGSVLGATLVVGLLMYLLRNINLVPVIGDWLSDIMSHVVNNLDKSTAR